MSMATTANPSETSGNLRHHHLMAPPLASCPSSSPSHEIFIDYKYHQRVISVCQIKPPKKSMNTLGMTTDSSSTSSSSSPLYRIVSVKYQNKNLSTEFIQFCLHQAIQNVILSPHSYDSKKKIKNTHLSDHESDDDSLNESSSPICVSNFPEDSHIYDQLYDKRVITSFKEIIFKCEEQELTSSQMSDHIPILISIEGNIGAGKSKFLTSSRISSL